MRVMISQPTGMDEEKARQERIEVAAMLEAQGYEVWAELSWRTTRHGADDQDLKLAGVQLLDMERADAVYFMDGWENSKVCRVMYEAAVAFGLKTMNIDRLKLQAFHHAADGYSYNTERNNKFFPDLLVPHKRHWKIIKTNVYMDSIFGYGEFLLDVNYNTLICVKQTIEITKNTYNSLWSAIYDNSEITINPENFCEDKNDARRFVNNAAKLFHNLRDAIINGDIYIEKDKYSGIEYELDKKGRYRITNYHNYPVACMYAIACSVLI